MQEILPLVLNGGDLTPLHTIPNWDRVPWLEEKRLALVVDQLPNPRAMVTHFPYQLMPPSFLTSKAKVNVWTISEKFKFTAVLTFQRTACFVLFSHLYDSRYNAKSFSASFLFSFGMIYGWCTFCFVLFVRQSDKMLLVLYLCHRWSMSWGTPRMSLCLHTTSTKWLDSLTIQGHLMSLWTNSWRAKVRSFTLHSLLIN